MAGNLGACRCPVCGNDDSRTHASESFKGLVCVTCMACKCQVFSRSDAPGMSGPILRGGLIAGAPQIPQQPVAAAADVRPPAKPPRSPRVPRVPDEKRAPVPDAAPEPMTQTAPVAKAMGWGIFR